MPNNKKQDKKNEKIQNQDKSAATKNVAVQPSTDELPVIQVNGDLSAPAEVVPGLVITTVEEMELRKNHPELSGDPDTWEERMEQEATAKENGAPALDIEQKVVDAANQVELEERAAAAAAAANGTTPESKPEEPAKDRVYHLRLTLPLLHEVIAMVTSEITTSKMEVVDAGNIEDETERAQFLKDKEAQLLRLTVIEALCVKAQTAPAGNGLTSNVKVFGKYAPVAILNWMGNRGFTVFDAKNGLAHFGVEDIEKTTFSRALAKGKDPVKNKVKIIDLEPEEELALFEFYDLAAREAAKAATAKIDAVKARIQALPVKQ